MTFNHPLEVHLRATLEDILVTAEERLRGWATALAEDQPKGRSKGRRTLATCRNRVRKLLSHAEPLFRWSVTRTGRGPFEVHWSRDEAAIHRRSLGFGRTLIYTDQHGWSDEEIVRAFRSKAVIEEEFRRLKDTSYPSDTPQYHWTDSRIKGHQLICFLALQLMTLLQRQLHRTGHVVTINELAHALQRWFQVVQLYPGGKVERLLRPMSPVQETLHQELHLEVYA